MADQREFLEILNSRKPRGAIILVAAVLAATTVQQWLFQTKSPEFVLVVDTMIGFIGIVTMMFYPDIRQAIIRLFMFQREPHELAGLYCLRFGAIVILTVVASYLCSFPSFLVAPETYGEIGLLDNLKDGPWGGLVLILVIIPIGALEEEIINRAAVLYALSAMTHSRTLHALISAAIFAVGHLSIGLHTVSGAFFFGMVTVLIMFSTRSILPLIVGHSLNNIWAL